MAMRFRILRDRNFLYLFLGGAVSNNGSAVSGIALTWLIYSQTQSALAVTLIGLATVVPTISLGLLAGAAVDRFNRKLLMISSDSVRAVAVLAVPILLFLSGFSLAWVLAIIILVSIFSTLFRTAQNAALPQLVRGEEIQVANGLLYSATTVMRTLGSAIGGIIYAVSIPICFIYDSLTYLFSASTVARVEFPKLQLSEDTDTARSTVKQVKDGLRYIIAWPALMSCTFGAIAVNFFSTMTTTFAVIYVSNQLRGDAVVFGVFGALLSAGAACGALLVGRLNAVRFAGKGIGASLVIFSLASLALSAERSIMVAYLMAVLLGASLSWANTVFYSTLQLTVTNEVLGRVLSVDEVFSGAIVPIAQIVGGLLIEVVGISVDYAAAGVGLLICSVLLLTLRDFRNFAYNPIKNQKP